MSTVFRHFEIVVSDDVVVLNLTDLELLDRLVTNELQNELLEYVETEQPQKLAISFNGVRRCSTEIINALLRARKRVTGYEGQLNLCGMRGSIRRVFKMLNLEDTVFEIHDTAADASEAF